MKLIGTDAVDIAKMKFSPTLSLLGAWLLAPSLGMIYGKRGSGKSFLAMAIALCVAGGGKFLKWASRAASRVAYVEGELGKQVIQNRVKALVTGCDYDFDVGQLEFLTYEDTGGVIPNLADPDWQEYYSQYIRHKDLIIFDHLSACVRPGPRETEVEAWARVQEWAIKARGDGKAIIFIHHAGKSGAQRGTSTREDALDYVIALRQPALYEATLGCQFELHFEKARHFFGEEAEPLSVELRTDDNDALSWTYKKLNSNLETKIFDLLEEGLTAHDIAGMLKLDIGSVKLIANKRIGDKQYANKTSDLF